MTRFRELRGKRAVDAVIDRSALPHEHRELVRRLVLDARLPAAASLDVAEELLWHFEDGLARGVGPDRLASGFGPVDQAAELIRRGQRRRRWAAPWRRRTLLLSAGIATSVMTAYATSAISLHGSDPIRVTTSGSPNPLDVPAWVREAGTASETRERARVRLRDAGPQTRRDAIIANLMDAAALRRAAALETDLAAIDIIHDAVAAAVADSAIDATIDAALARALAPDGTLLRAAVIEDAYRDLLDRVYSGREADARLTAKGLRVLQALQGKTRPGTVAVILEPAYFVRPASRSTIEREIAALVAEVEQAARARPNDGSGRLRMRQAALAREPMRALRSFPVAVTVPRLALAAERAGRVVRVIDAARRSAHIAGRPGALGETGS